MNENWLNFVKTSKARSEIKSYLRSLRLDEFEKIGREEISILAKEFTLIINNELIEKSLGKFNQGKSVKEIYCLIAEGKIKKKEFLKILFPEFDKTKFDIDKFNLYQYIHNPNKDEAFDILKKQDVSVILLDLIMPDIDGFELYQKIRQKYNIPVVLVTADRSIETIDKIRQLGIDDYLTKPLHAYVVKETIQSITNNWDNWNDFLSMKHETDRRHSISEGV